MEEFEIKETYNAEDFRKLIAYLRSDKGCMWDREQTHESIRRNLLEEAYEVCEAIDEGDPLHLREELGDLMMQVLFHSNIEEANGSFDLDDVADAACKKLVYRHPHVFGDASVSSSEDVLLNWDELKKAERAQKTTSSIMDSVARTLPGLWRIEKIQNKAKKVGFDWPDVSGAMDKLREEVDELQDGIDMHDMENIKEELGDVLFCVVNAARFFDLDCEVIAHAACEKFIRRFNYMEAGAAKRGVELCEANMPLLEELYQEGRSLLENKKLQHPFTTRSPKKWTERKTDNE